MHKIIYITLLISNSFPNTFFFHLSIDSSQLHSRDNVSTFITIFDTCRDNYVINQLKLFFDPIGKKDLRLYQYFFWFIWPSWDAYSHHVWIHYNIIIYIILTFLRISVFEYLRIIYVITNIVVIKFFIWTHHIFTVDLNVNTCAVFYATNNDWLSSNGTYNQFWKINTRAIKHWEIGEKLTLFKFRYDNIVHQILGGT